MKKRLILFWVLIFSFSIPFLAFGDNIRPVSPLGPSFGGENSLQYYFDQWEGVGTINAINDQLPYSIFRPNENVVETTFKLEVTAAYPGRRYVWNLCGWKSSHKAYCS